MATATIVFRKDKLNKNSEGPIHYRVIQNRKPKYISSGIKVHLDEWDFNQKKVKSKHRNSNRINALLSSNITEILNDLYEHEQHKKEFKLEKVKDDIKPKREYIDFIENGKEVLKDYLRNDQIGTYDKNNSVIKKLEKYIGNKKLYFSDITPKFLTEYEHYMRNLKRPNSTNTINKNFKYFKKLFNKAIREGLIKIEDNPFNIFKLKQAKVEKVFLDWHELKLLEDYEAPLDSNIDLHRDMFVFACYSAGLRVSDMLKLRWRDFDGTKLHVIIKKTKNQISVKLPNKALEILAKYKTDDTKPNDFIFPVFKKGLDLNNVRDLNKATSRCTALINKSLKKIEIEVGLTKHISFHISRHTFATLALSLGMSIEKVAKLLGHTSLKQVQVYAKIVDRDLDSAMDVFNTV